MGVLNCWNWKNCGREPGGAKAAELGVCPAATCEEADGYLGGRGAGRSCVYKTGTLCGGKVQGSFVQKQQSCQACDFYQVLKKEYGSQLSSTTFKEYCMDNNFKTPPTKPWVDPYKTGKETAQAAKRNYPLKKR